MSTIDTTNDIPARSARALLVGINAYPDPYVLRGCINDVFTYQSILVNHFQFDSQQIATLLDAEATSANIIQGLQSLVAEAKPGQTLVFSYSGHGSQVKDPNGQAVDKKGRLIGLEDVICPVDVDWRKPFTGRKIHDILQPAVDLGAKVFMLMDCCHSGHLDRVMSAADGALGCGSNVRVRYMPPPSGLSRSTAAFEPRVTLTNALCRKTLSGKRIVLLSACQDFETSADAYLNRQYHGAFTFYLNETLVEHGWWLEWWVLHKEVQKKLRCNGFNQSPSLEGVEKESTEYFMGGQLTKLFGAMEEANEDAVNRMIRKPAANMTKHAKARGIEIDEQKISAFIDDLYKVLSNPAVIMALTALVRVRGAWDTEARVEQFLQDQPRFKEATEELFKSHDTMRGRGTMPRDLWMFLVYMAGEGAMRGTPSGINWATAWAILGTVGAILASL